ncbi:unnamed protein product, partial [Prorocentrum cordatum]
SQDREPSRAPHRSQRRRGRQLLEEEEEEEEEEEQVTQPGPLGTPGRGSTPGSALLLRLGGVLQKTLGGALQRPRWAARPRGAGRWGGPPRKLRRCLNRPALSLHPWARRRRSSAQPSCSGSGAIFIRSSMRRMVIAASVANFSDLSLETMGSRTPAATESRTPPLVRSSPYHL